MIYVVRQVCYDYEDKAVSLRVTKLKDRGKNRFIVELTHPPNTLQTPCYVEITSLYCLNNFQLPFLIPTDKITLTDKERGEGVGQNRVSTFCKPRVSPRQGEMSNLVLTL